MLEKSERDYQQKIQPTNERSPFLERYYEIRDTITYDEVREEVASFFVGGFDTTGKALPGILLLLAMNQNIQEKLFEEIMKTFSPDSGEVDEESLFKTEYLDLVIKESLRLLPVALMFGRLVTKDLKLSKKFN